MSSKKLWRSARLAACIALGVVVAAPARADDFYKGKTFTIVVGFSPAGGYDTYARVLARHIAAHIPGHPSVIVQNMPGAGSVTAVRYLNLTAPRDGTVMAIFNPGVVTQSVVAPERVNINFGDYAWVGVVAPELRVCYGYGPNGVRSWDDMMHRQQFVIGSTGKGSGNYLNGAMLRAIFHAPVKQVLGFPGSAEQRLAVERGELDGDCGAYSSIPTEWLKNGLAHAFVRFSRERPPEVPESAVYIGALAASDRQRQILQVLNGGDELGRMFIMSKMAPADRIATMRKAFDDTMKDPDFLAEMAKLELPVHPLSGAEADAIAAEMANTPPDIVAEAKFIYQ
jgi:tripartite-type tricarboxylate transporter receptor subunit TctC